MGNRSENLVGQDCICGFRNIYNGVLQDAFSITGVQLLDAEYNPIGFFPPSAIEHTGLGSYQLTIPGSNFPAAATYHDVWQVIGVSGADQRNLIFDINVVTVPSQPVVNQVQLLSRSVADMTAEALKRYYLYPVWQMIANGYYIPDNVLQYHIDMQISWMQRQLGIPLQQVRVLTPPFAADQTPANPVLGVDYDEIGSLLQWSAIFGQVWSTIRLPHSGIIRVNRVRGIYAGRTVYNIPNEWVQGNELKMGYVRIRPTSAGALNNIVDNSGQFLDVTLLEATGSTVVPGFWAVDYDYGQPNGQFHAEIGDVIFKKAACIILDQLATAISRGIAARSFGVDGLSTSVNSVLNAERTQFGALAARYEQDLTADNIGDMRARYKGPSVFIL